MAVPTVENQTFYVGQVFDDYDSFKTALRKFERATNTKFSIRRCDKIDVRPGYSSVQLGCKHYGKKRNNPNLLGIRPRQKTYKIDCTASINLLRTKDKRNLYIDHLQLEHSHVTNRITAAGYPENRKVSKESSIKAAGLQKLKVKPTLIRPLLKTLDEDENKIILGRDISNIGTKQKSTERKGRSDEEMLRDKLAEIKSKDPGANIHIDVDPISKEVVFIFIQTTDMRENLKKFPEVILMDATYKINKNRMPFSVVEVMDGDGQGLVVAYAFLANETKDTLSAMLRQFVEASGKDAFESTECCVVDKDFSEICAVKEVLPHVAVHICSVHTEKNFKKLAKDFPNKKETFALMKSMIYCETQEQFDKAYDKLKSCAAPELMQSFDKNWLHCKEAWSLKDKILAMTLRNHSTNRVERHNRLLKLVFNVDTELYEAVEGLVNIILANKKDDQLYKIHEALVKKTYINKCSDPNIQAICNDLTDFACKIVCEQLQLSKKPSPFPDKYQANEASCTCLLFKTMKLPCRHMMRYRRQAGHSVFSKEHVLQRWWKDYNVVDDAGNAGMVVDPSQSKGESQNLIQPKLPGEALVDVLTPAEKYKKFVPLVPKLKTAVCEAGTRVFYLRYQALVEIIEAWNSGTEVAIVHINTGHIEDFDLQTIEQPIVVDVINTSEQQLNSDKEFVLNKVVMKGKSSGRNETIHDGSKKKGNSRKKQVKMTDGQICCCVCGKEAGSHKCITCGEVVHAIPPCSVPPSESEAEEGYGQQPRICKGCQDSQNEEQFQETEDAAGNHCKDLSATDTQDVDNGQICCCVCGKEAGSHKCITCGEVVHAIPPCSVPHSESEAEEGYGQPRICKGCQDSQNEEQFQETEDAAGNHCKDLSATDTQDVDNYIEDFDSQPFLEPPDFKLRVVRTKGRNKTKQNGPPKWNYTNIADSVPSCCICGKNVNDDHVCSKCKSSVHGSHPCSNRDGVAGRVCNFCEGPSQEPVMSSPAVYKCYGCDNILNRKVTKYGINAGRVYYGCDENLTPKCLRFKFWASVEKKNSRKTKSKEDLQPASVSGSAETKGRHRPTSVSYLPRSFGDSKEGHRSVSAFLPRFLFRLFQQFNFVSFQLRFYLKMHAYTFCGERGLVKNNPVVIDLTCDDDDDDVLRPIENKVKEETGDSEGFGHCSGVNVDADPVLTTDLNSSESLQWTDDDDSEDDKDSDSQESVSDKADTHCEICGLPQPPIDHKCCGTCKNQNVTDSHKCRCIVCRRAITKRVEKCFRCMRTVHNKCASVHIEEGKGGITVIICNNCKIAKDTGLPPSALDDLLEERSLTDEHLNAACTMLKKTFSDLGGLTTPENIICDEDHIRVAPYIVQEGEDYLQILNTGTGHWVLLIVSEGKPFLMDSFFMGHMTIDTQKQVKEIMSSGEDITVYIPDIQQQNNATDCGLYVIANAVEFAYSRQICKVSFIKKELRSHWMKCLNEGYISPFPRESMEELSHDTDFRSLLISVTPSENSESVIDGKCQNCLLVNPLPGHTCCKYCKTQNKRRGHICDCVVCSLPTSDNANMKPLCCNGCAKPVHEFCSKFFIEKESRYCFFCKIKNGLKLEKEVVQEILRRRLVSHDHMKVASSFIKTQFSDLAGLADPINFIRKKEYQPFMYEPAKDNEDYLQFLNSGTDHWFLLIVQGGKPYLVGSDVKGKLTSEIESQVASVINCFTDNFTIYMPAIMNDQDSGLLAIAYAIEFAETRDILMTSFNDMSEHWLQCLVEEKISRFPSSNIQAVDMDTTTTKVYCICRLPEHYSEAMIQCDVCNEWYHHRCVEAPIEDVEWTCPICKQ